MLRRKADKQVFWVYNNHLDHISDQARILGIHKVLDRVSGDQQKFAFPVFICGDFNARSDSETIRYCENYADFPIVELNKGCGLTCHNYGTYKMGDPYDHIDYIYVNKETAANPYTVTVWTDTTDGIWLSDHYPICAEVELGNT
jgi:endonuclease/exonuclease/phosphatase family metal-dependent hydrolase